MTRAGSERGEVDADDDPPPRRAVRRGPATDARREPARTDAAPRKQRFKEPDPDYLFSDQVGYLLRRAYQRHIAIFQATTSAWDVTSVQFSTLCALKNGGPQAQGDLVKATSVDQATIRGIIERLKSRGLVRIAKDRDDGRKVIVSLSPEGAEVVEQMMRPARDVTELTFGPLNPAERTALLFTLRRMIEGSEE